MALYVLVLDIVQDLPALALSEGLPEVEEAGLEVEPPSIVTPFEVLL